MIVPTELYACILFEYHSEVNSNGTRSNLSLIKIRIIVHFLWIFLKCVTIFETMKRNWMVTFNFPYWCNYTVGIHWIDRIDSYLCKIFTLNWIHSHGVMLLHLYLQLECLSDYVESNYRINLHPIDSIHRYLLPLSNRRLDRFCDIHLNR